MSTAANCHEEAETVKKTLGTALGALVVLVGLPNLALAETVGVQDFLVVFTGAVDAPGRVVATGTLTSVGTAVTPEGQRPTPFPVALSFPEGDLFLTITPTGNDLQFNPETCIFSGPIFGTYQITGGTGQLTGASGSGTFEGFVFLLFGRDAQGQCVDPASGTEPLFGVQVVRNPGTLSLPAAAAA